MKTALFLIMMCLAVSIQAQIAINTDGTNPDNSAMLDVKSTTKGLLPPRMTLAQRNAIVSPASGLTIFQTDGSRGYYYNSGSSTLPIWVMVGNNAGQWINIGSSIYYSLGNVGIGDFSASPLNNKLQVNGDLGIETSYPFINFNATEISDNIGLSFQATGLNKGWIYYNGSLNSLILNTDNGPGFRSDLVIQQDGLVGIGDYNPVARLHVFKSSPGYTAAFGTPISTFSASTNVAIGDDSNNAVLYVGQDQNHKGFLNWNYNIDPALASFSVGSYSGANDLILQEVGGNVGIGVSYPDARFHVAESSPGNTGLFGIPICTYWSGTNVTIGDDNANSLLTIGQDTCHKGVIAWNYNANVDIAYFGVGTYYAYNPLILQQAGGNVGVGVSYPVARFHVAEGSPGYTGLFGTLISGYYSGTNLSIGDDNANSLLYVGQSEANKGFLCWNYDATAGNAYFGVGSFAGNNPLILQQAGGNVGIGTTLPNSKLEVSIDANAFSQLGINSINNSYFYHNEQVADGDGQTALYAYRTRSVANDGTGYAFYTSNSALNGFSYWGDLYSFGTSGFNYNENTRCGGVLGAYQAGSYWGSLGYKNSSSNNYGGYFTSYTIGSGKSSQAETGIGLGAWGDLMGADIHGKVYGIYAEGGNYATYSNGPVYKNNIDVHLQENGTGANTALYTNVSTEVTVQTCGVATLSNGKASIAFDPSFTKTVSTEAPVIVTVTPIGNSNGVYLAEVSGSGFTVVENNAGKSNITVNYIAIGKRAGYERPNLAREVMDAGYTNNLARGLHNDADTQANGEGLYYENGQLMVGIHPSMLPDPNKPAEETFIPKQSVKPVISDRNELNAIGIGNPEPARPAVAPKVTSSSVASPASGAGSSDQLKSQARVKINYPEKETSTAGPFKLQKQQQTVSPVINTGKNASTPPNSSQEHPE